MAYSAVGDAASAALVDCFLGVAAFLGRHRVDNAVEASHVFLGVRVAHHAGSFAQAGDLANDRTHGAEFLRLAEHFLEVVERELALQQRLLLLGHFLFVELLLSVLDQREDIAHSQDSAGHAVGVKLLERVEVLARAYVLQRYARYVLDR